MLVHLVGILITRSASQDPRGSDPRIFGNGSTWLSGVVLGKGSREVPRGEDEMLRKTINESTEPDTGRQGISMAASGSWFQARTRCPPKYSLWRVSHLGRQCVVCWRGTRFERHLAHPDGTLERIGLVGQCGAE